MSQCFQIACPPLPARRLLNRVISQGGADHTFRGHCRIDAWSPGRPGRIHPGALCGWVTAGRQGRRVSRLPAPPDDGRE